MTRGGLIANECAVHRKSLGCAHCGSVFVNWDKYAVACYDESNHTSVKLRLDGRSRHAAARAQSYFVVARDALMANEDPIAALFKACEAGSTKGLGI